MHKLESSDSYAKARLAWTVFAAALLATAFATFQVKQNAEHDALVQIAFACDQIAQKLRDRLAAHALILRGGAALFGTSSAVERGDWRAYVETLQAERSVPGIQGIGFARVIAAGQLAAHISRTRGEGFPEYEVRPAGERAIYTSIIYLEPFRERNLRAFGFDMFSEPVRRAAMEQARDTGEAALSGKVELVQETETDVQAGTLMYVPAYRSDMPSATPSQRKAALIGWAYSPYRMNDLMAGILGDWKGKDGRTYELHLYDGARAAPAAMLFDSGGGHSRELHSQFRQLRTIEFNGRQLLLALDNDSGGPGMNYPGAWLTLAAGLAFSCLLLMLALTTANTRVNALRIAGQLTEKLRHREALLKESETRFRTMADCAPVLIWTAGVDKLCNYFNQVWLEFTGRSIEQEMGNGWTEGVHAEDLQRCLATYGSAFDARQPFAMEYRLRRFDGEYRWLLDNGVPRHDDAGAFIGYIGSCIDVTERRQAEETLRINKALLADNATEVIWTMDLQGRYTYVSPSVEKLRGYSRAEVMRQSLEQSLTPASAPIAAKAVARAIEAIDAGLPVPEFMGELEHSRKHGASVWTEVSLRGVLDAGGACVGLLGVMRDITERKQAERALHESEQVYRTMIDSAPEGVWMIGPDRRTTEVNQRLCNLFGYAREEMLGRDPVEFADAGNGRIFQAMARLAPNRRTRIYEVAVRHRDGYNISTEFSATNLFNEDGSVMGVIAFVVELTARKQAEEQLKQLSHRLLLATSSARLGVWDWNVRDNTMLWDERMFELYGIARDTSSNSIETWMNCLHPEDRETAIAECQAALSGEKEFDTVFRVLQPGGTVRYLKANGLVLRGADGLAERMIGINTDITEGKRAELERTRLEAQLRESQKMEALGTMAGGVAHDFNNALAMIIGNVELARQDVGSGHPALVSLEEVDKASRRARDLVQQILAFGRRQKLERKATSLSLVVVETARLVRATLPAMVKLEVDCEPDAPATLADAMQVKQILLNLCGNAIQAIQDQGGPGKVEINLRAHVQSEAVASSGLKPGRYACLTVRDTGPGMDEATRSHIFEPFFTTKPVGKGTGLGLAVVHGIVQAHEATVDVESAPGKGSAFRIYFPAIDAQVEAVAQSQAGALQVDGAGKRVLYIDDEEAIIFLMKRLLERQGFRVSGFTDPREAIAAVKANPAQFDLAVTDFNMPGMSGLAVATALREIRADLPVILASGYITEELRQKAPAAGVRELIYKPNTLDDLCEAVARCANAQIKVA